MITFVAAVALAPMIHGPGEPAIHCRPPALTPESSGLAVQDAGPMREVEELRREVETLRTIHQLQLTREQLQKLVRVSKEARKSVDDAVAERKDEIEALKKALKEYREALEKGGTDLEERERAVHEQQRAMGEAMRRVHEVGEKLGSDIKEILDERQWKRIGDMHRPDPTRPIRDQVMRLLDRFREGSDAEMTEEALRQLREAIERMAKPLGLTEKDLEDELDRIRKILEEAFKSSPEDLTKKRDEFVRRIFEEGKIGEAAKRMAPPQEEGKRRIAQVFLNAKVIAFLEKRLENAK